MIATLVYLKYFSFLLSSLFVFFALGHSILLSSRKLFEVKGWYTNLFTKILLGLTACVIIYSATITRARTINLGLVVLLMLLCYEFWRYKKRNREVFVLGTKLGLRPGKVAIVAMSVLSAGIFLWFAHLILKPGSEFGYYLPDKGKIYYANIADMLSLGQENRWGVSNAIENYYHGMAPYHYFELWLANFFSVCTRTPGIVGLYVFVYPLLNILTALGLLAFCEKLGRVNLVSYVLVILLLFCGGFYFNMKDPDFSYSMNFGESPMEFMGEKYVSYYPFIILSFLLFADKRVLMGSVALLLVPVVSISTLPGVFAALLAAWALFFFKKIVSGFELLHFLGALVVLATFLSFIYSRLDSPDNPYFVNGIFYYTDLQQASFSSIKIFLVELLYRIWDCPLKFLLLHALFIPCIVILWRSKRVGGYKPMVIFIVIMYCVSLLLYGVFYKLFDAIQFYTNDFTFLNVFLAFTIIGLVYSGELKKKWHMVLFTPLLFCLVYKISFAYEMHAKNIRANQVYSDKYMAEVKAWSSTIQQKQLVGALFGVGAGELNVHNDDKSGISCYYLAYLPSFYPGIDLSVFDIKDWSGAPEIAEVEKASVQQSPLTRFVENQPKEGKFVSKEQSRVGFIRKYKIHYLVISKHAPADTLIEKLVDKQVVDALSGERFVHLAY